MCRCVEYPTALASHLGDKVGQQVVIIFSRGSAERALQPARPEATTQLLAEKGGEAIAITVGERLVSAQAGDEAISVTVICGLNGPFVRIPSRNQCRVVVPVS